MAYTSIPLNGSLAALDISIFTIIGLLLCLSVMVFGMIRTFRSQGNPRERQSGIATTLYGAMSVPILLVFIEIPHQLFF